MLRQSIFDAQCGRSTHDIIIFGQGAHMQRTVVVVMCHALGAFAPQSVDTLPDPICREVLVVKDDMPMQSCKLSQAALADWKERSIYRDDQWMISRIKCVPGDYVPKQRV